MFTQLLKGSDSKEDDVLIAIDKGIIRTYVTDFPSERYLDNDQVICIPHLGASTYESEVNCAMMATEELMDFLETEILKTRLTSYL